ncbi:MAG: extracellular solute-binding protein, partial [Lachnospiraceae bacterium]|nr:extracellular solute-binding protein [Lachnospiraceae bacterium]
MKISKTIFAVPVIAAMLLTGCGGSAGNGQASGDALNFSTASGDASNELVVSIGDEADTEVLNQIVTNFKKDNPDFPYTVKSEIISESDASNKVLGDINAAPDIFTFADDQLNALTASGILQPITDSSIKSDNLDAADDAASIDGKLYAYPMTADNGYF